MFLLRWQDMHLCHYLRHMEEVLVHWNQASLMGHWRSRLKKRWSFSADAVSSCNVLQGHWWKFKSDGPTFILLLLILLNSHFLKADLLSSEQRTLPESYAGTPSLLRPPKVFLWWFARATTLEHVRQYSSSNSVACGSNSIFNWDVYPHNWGMW